MATEKERKEITDFDSLDLSSLSWRKIDNDESPSYEETMEKYQAMLPLQIDSKILQLQALMTREYRDKTCIFQRMTFYITELGSIANDEESGNFLIRGRMNFIFESSDGTEKDTVRTSIVRNDQKERVRKGAGLDLYKKMLPIIKKEAGKLGRNLCHVIDKSSMGLSDSQWEIIFGHLFEEQKYKKREGVWQKTYQP